MKYNKIKKPKDEVNYLLYLFNDVYPKIFNNKKEVILVKKIKKHLVNGKSLRFLFDDFKFLIKLMKQPVSKFNHGLLPNNNLTSEHLDLLEKNVEFSYDLDAYIKRVMLIPYNYYSEYNKKIKPWLIEYKKDSDKLFKEMENFYKLNNKYFKLVDRINRIR